MSGMCCLIVSIYIFYVAGQAAFHVHWSILFLHNLRESHMTSSMPGVDEVVTQTFQAFDFINVIKHMHTFYSFVFPIFF